MLRVKIRLYFQIKTLAKEALVLNRSTGREKPVNKDNIQTGSEMEPPLSIASSKNSSE